MAWLPFEKYKLRSPLTLEQIGSRIKDADTEAYGALLSGNTFYIQPVTGFKLGAYSQSFKPEAEITIHQTANESEITVVIKPKAGAIAVLFLVAMLLFAATWFSQRQNIALGNYRDTLIVGTGLLVLGYLLPVSAFNDDTDHLKSFITQILEPVDKV